MKKTFLAAIVVATWAWRQPCPFVGWAQDQPPAQGDHVAATRRRARRPGGPAGAWAARWAGGFAFREVMRDLTDAQREQVKAIHGASRRAHAAARRARARSA